MYNSYICFICSIKEFCMNYKIAAFILCGAFAGYIFNLLSQQAGGG